MSDKILRFTASWCNPCKMLAKSLKTADLQVPIEVVDIDLYYYVAAAHMIRSVPTLVYLRDGVEIGRKVGMQNPNQLKEWVSAL